MGTRILWISPQVEIHFLLWCYYSLGNNSTIQITPTVHRVLHYQPANSNQLNRNRPQPTLSQCVDTPTEYTYVCMQVYLASVQSVRRRLLYIRLLLFIRWWFHLWAHTSTRAQEQPRNYKLASCCGVVAVDWGDRPIASWFYMRAKRNASLAPLTINNNNNCYGVQGAAGTELIIIIIVIPYNKRVNNSCCYLSRIPRSVSFVGFIVSPTHM